MTGIDAIDQWLKFTAAMPVLALAFVAPLGAICGAAVLIGVFLRRWTTLRVTRRTAMAVWLAYGVVSTVAVVAASATVSPFLAMPLLFWPLPLMAPLLKGNGAAPPYQ